jgi:hypothetical protein
MRSLFAALGLLLLTACIDATPGAGDDLAGAPAEGYTLEVRADGAQQIYLVTSPEGRTVGARVADGASALLDNTTIQALATPLTVEGDQMHEVVSLRMPGLNLSVSGDPENKDGTNTSGGRVAINIAGHSIEVNADEGEAGDGDDRAHVLVRGVPESEAREFIVKADQLSPAVQAQMLAELGLE